jgi:hypothetical protein
MRTAHLWLLAVLAGLILWACEIPEHTFERWERRTPTAGAGVANALHVWSVATSLATPQSIGVAPQCGAPNVEPDGPVTVTTRIVWVRKAPAVDSVRIAQTDRWWRDADGHTRWDRRTTSRIPDGRLAVRQIGVWDVDGQCAREVEGRAVVDPDPDRCRRDLHDRRTQSLDALVGLLPDPGFAGCSPLQIPDVAPVWSFTTDGQGGRHGWARWSDRRGYTLAVAFDEDVEPDADDVLASEVFTSLDPIVDWATVDQFVSDGLEQGWLQAPRAVEVQAP